MTCSNLNSYLRPPEKLISINCAVLKSELAESALFGYVKGSHSTANEDKAGAIENAGSGTLFLDEIGALDLDVQKMLLTFLDEGHFYRMGDYETKYTSNIQQKYAKSKTKLNICIFRVATSVL